MSLFRALATFIVLTLLMSCQAAESLLKAPFNLVKGVLSPIGRVGGSSSENTRMSGDMRIESREVNESLAGGAGIDVKPQTIAPVIVQR